MAVTNLHDQLNLQKKVLELTVQRDRRPSPSWQDGVAAGMRVVWSNNGESLLKPEAGTRESEPRMMNDFETSKFTPKQHASCNQAMPPEPPLLLCSDAISKAACRGNSSLGLAVSETEPVTIIAGSTAAGSHGAH